MLAEVQAANSALAAITGAIQNGKDLTDIAGSCADYFNCKSIVARAFSNSVWALISSILIL